MSVPRQGHNTPLPLERSPPASFKRLLGSAVRGVLASRQCAVLPVTFSVNALRNRVAPVFLLTLVGGPGHSDQVLRAAPLPRAMVVRVVWQTDERAGPSRR